MNKQDSDGKKQSFTRKSFELFFQLFRTYVYSIQELNHDEMKPTKHLNTHFKLSDSLFETSRLDPSGPKCFRANSKSNMSF